MGPFESLDALKAALDRLRAAPAPTIAGGWTPAQVLEHCAQSIDCQMKGFPAMKPAVVRATVGRVVLGVFLARGRMSHDRVAQVPGLEAPVNRPWAEAVDRLAASVRALQGWQTELAPHAVFGAMSKARGERYHAIHVSDHLRDWPAPG